MRDRGGLSIADFLLAGTHTTFPTLSLNMLASRSIAAIASRPALYSTRRLVTTEVTRPEHTPAAVDSVSGAPGKQHILFYKKHLSNT